MTNRPAGGAMLDQRVSPRTGRRRADPWETESVPRGGEPHARTTRG
jgi:hypothetical protein